MDQYPRRLFAVALSVLLCVAAFGNASIAAAQTFPDHPIRLVLGFAAGGPLDTATRIVAQDMAQTLGQPIVVENKAGASGQIATDYVAHAPADGYTLLSTASTFVVNPVLLPKVNSDPIKDFTPVAHFASLPTILIVPPDSKANSVRDLVNMAKAEPGSVTFGSAGTGGPAHLAGELLASTTGTKMTHVPFKGAAPALLEVMAGRVSFTFYTMSGLKEQVEAKKVKPLAITAPKRHPDFPNVPTMTEAGFPGFDEVGAWFGIVAPAGTPAPVIARLNDAVNKALAKADVKEKINKLGAVTTGGTPDAFKSFLEKDFVRWSTLIKAAGIKPE
jgi:tripartite-type tricarboxylate transporter receptor subunit TctC